ncbi:MAG TPA: hypothetical protein VF940_27845, partial [Streptosporangiaceae bacterium]
MTASTQNAPLWSQASPGGRLGGILAQQLGAGGEQALDVQPKLAARVRLRQAGGAAYLRRLCGWLLLPGQLRWQDASLGRPPRRKMLPDAVVTWVPCRR